MMRGTPVLAMTVIVLAAVRIPAHAQDRDSLLTGILAAEDSRAPRLDSLDPILAGLRSRDPDVQRKAVRALGRLERSSLVPLVEPLLVAEHASVRSEAVNALGQLVGEGEAKLVMPLLLARLRTESHAGVRGTIGRTLGRLPLSTPDQVRETARVLVEASWLGSAANRTDAPLETTVGITYGLESLIRQQRGRYLLSSATRDRLSDLAGGLRTGAGAPDVTDLAALQRRLATSALVSSGSLDGTRLRRALSDPDADVRRIAIGGLARGSRVIQDSLFSGLFTDASPRVRYEALRTYGSVRDSTAGCEQIRRSATDPDTHVMLLAIDLLGSSCGSTPGLEQTLATWASSLSPSARVWDATWHRPAHALVALAEVSAERARTLLPQFAAHGNWLVRVYAARAARHVPAVGLLETLAQDENDNVRTEAIVGLSSLVGHEGDSLYLAALVRPDYQLLITAARALEGSGADRAVPALLTALRRVTAERRMTSRDTRMALLNRAAALEGAALAGALLPYLRDFDSVVAQRAGTLLTEWMGRPNDAQPEPLPDARVPTLSELADLAGQHVTVAMRSGGHVVIELFPEDAPTNAIRFARLARAGYYDGLTFHRVVPNFVVQGGSPGANEYMGDGPYSRDELGLRSHVRGTVGISTRGRDTGDAQIFVNLVDNVRLDHNYTIFGAVVSGMDIVYAMLEGATIERVTVGSR